MLTDYIIDLGIQVIRGTVIGSVLGVSVAVAINYLTRGYQTGQIGYKKLSNGYIAKLKILDENNENRKTCENKLFAKHRCRRAKVLDIYHWLDEKNKRATGVSMQDSSFIYKVGQIVQVNNYDTNYDDVCSSGVHYFLTEECAKYYELNLDPPLKNHEFYTGPYKRWTESGILVRDCSYKNGYLVGEYKEYGHNGKLFEKSNYENGRRNGECKKYHYDGQLAEKSNYKNGWLDGEYRKWTEDGELISHLLYVDGSLVKNYLQDVKDD